MGAHPQDFVSGGQSIQVPPTHACGRPCTYSDLYCVLLILTLPCAVSCRTGFPRLLENPGIFIGKFPGPGKSWNLLSNDADGSFWFQMDMFINADKNRHNCCFFWVAGKPEVLSRPGFLPRTLLGHLQRFPRLLSCCLLLYLNISGLRRGPGKMFLGAWKVLEKSWNFL